MTLALALAKKSAEQGEVPVGAVLVRGETLLASAHNQPIALHDPTAHAEILAIRSAAQQEGNYRLLDTTLYVTLEPCMMCVGALVYARIKRVVFGARDPKSGAVESCGHYLDAKHHNHVVEHVSGILAESCGQLLRNFFKERRS